MIRYYPSQKRHFLQRYSESKKALNQDIYPAFFRASWRNSLSFFLRPLTLHFSEQYCCRLFWGTNSLPHMPHLRRVTGSEYVSLASKAGLSGRTALRKYLHTLPTWVAFNMGQSIRRSFSASRSRHIFSGLS